MITTILERTITKHNVVSLKNSFVPVPLFVPDIFKKWNSEIVDISMFITICSIVPLIFNKLDIGIKIGYKYIYVKAN